MMQLEDLKPTAAVSGVLRDSLVTVVSVQWFGSEALELTYKTPTGQVANELLYRADEARLEVVEQGRPWSFDGDAARARAAVMEVERGLGFEPVDRETDKLGYDIESRVPETGRLRFIEVKGRVSGAATITVTKNEILYSLNKPDHFILAIVEFLDAKNHRVHYVRRPFHREPDFGVTSVNYDFAKLLARAEAPR